MLIQNDAAAEKATQDCVGKYEYMPTAAGRAMALALITIKVARSTKAATRDRTSMEYTWKYTGGTGKSEGASGGGTYFYESLTDTLAGGTYKGKLVLP